MPELMQIPAWLGAAVVAGIITAIGYVAKQILDWLATARATKATRFARLVDLQSLLRAGWVIFAIQNDHAKRLLTMIKEHHGDLVAKGKGYEHTFAMAYSYLTPEEQELHSIIRSITVHAMRPTNQSMLEWLKGDTYFKAQWHHKDIGSELAQKLAELEAHLILWQAVYEVRIPNSPAHALLYLADEKEYGVEFPSGLDKIVEKAFKEPSLFSG